MNQETATTAQLKCINTLFRKLNTSTSVKEAMLLGFTGNRTDNISDLYKGEAISLIRHLKETDPEERKAEVMRRKIISRAYEMGWITHNGKIDMKRIDEWCKNFSYLKKKLNQYQYKELPLLVSVFEEKIYKQFLNGL